MATFKVRNISSKHTMQTAFERAVFDGYVWAETNSERGYKQVGFTPDFYDFEDGDIAIVVDESGNEIDRATFTE